MLVLKGGLFVDQTLLPVRRKLLVLRNLFLQLSDLSLQGWLLQRLGLLVGIDLFLRDQVVQGFPRILSNDVVDLGRGILDAEPVSTELHWTPVSTTHQFLRCVAQGPILSTVSENHRSARDTHRTGLLLKIPEKGALEVIRRIRRPIHRRFLLVLLGIRRGLGRGRLLFGLCALLFRRLGLGLCGRVIGRGG